MIINYFTSPKLLGTYDYVKAIEKKISIDCDIKGTSIFFAIIIYKFSPPSRKTAALSFTSLSTSLCSTLSSHSPAAGDAGSSTFTPPFR